MERSGQVTRQSRRPPRRTRASAAAVPGHARSSPARRWWAHLGTLLVVTALLPNPVDAQTAVPIPQGRRVGLVLSGGSSKGLAHIGVLRTLEAAGVRPALVTGTSMGAIVGGLYATGVSTDSLAALAERLEWDALLSDGVERSFITPHQRTQGNRLLIEMPFENRHVRLPTGVMEGSAIYRTLSDLVWPWATVRDFRALPIPFAAVATDLATGEGVRLEGGVLADAIRASMAVPGVIDPVVMDGRILVDGGLARNLPAEDALALGADFLICSDVSDPLKDPERLRSLVDVLVQAVAFRMTESVDAQRHLCDILIRPDIEGLSSRDFARADEWIARGEVATGNALRVWALTVESEGMEPAATAPEAEAGGVRTHEVTVLPISDSVRVTELRLEGLDDPDARRLVQRIVGVWAPAWVARPRLDAALEHLAASELFRSLRYRLDVAGGDTTLVLHVEPRTADRVGVGLRYDDHYGAALLFSGTFSNWARYGSLTQLDVRLGDEVQIQGQFLVGRGLTSAFSTGATVGWSRAPFDMREGGRTVARGEVDWFSARSLVGSTLGRTSFVGLDAGAEWAHGKTVVAPFDSTGSLSLVSGAVVAFRESLDDADFPMTGMRIHVRGEVGVSTADAGSSFHHEVADVLVARPLTEDVSLLLGGYAGHGGGPGLPPHRTFYIGGVRSSSVFAATQRPFLGLEVQERRGTTAQILRAGVRWRLRKNRYLTVALDAGGTQDRWSFDTDAYTVGWGVEVAAASILGPLSLALHGHSPDLSTLSFSVGRTF